MTRRFYLPEIIVGELQILTGSEARHLRQVLRMELGDRLRIFDGKGIEAEAIITKLAINDTGTEDVFLQILDRKTSTNELPFSLTIAAAVPKGDRLKWMIEKLTELGVTRFIPLVTARSIVDPREGKIERLKQTVIESSKQCGRSSLMEVSPVLEWSPFLKQLLMEKHSSWIAHPYGMASPLALTQIDSSPCTLIIGPEGGFTEQEVAAATQQGVQLLLLGQRILRIETAAIAAATLFGIGREEMDPSR